jgi:CheY-like chemotaxis protein
MFYPSEKVNGVSVTMLTKTAPMEILLIEDEEDAISRVEEAITESKLSNKVVVAKSPAEAIQYLRQSVATGPYDLEHQIEIPGLILLDVNLDAKRGFDVLHDLRTDPKLMTIPIVILTDSLEETDLACSMAHGVTGYFLKPMDAVQFKKVVKDVEEHWSLLRNAPCAN